MLGILSVAFLLVGCEKNELPTFSASDSFIAFTSSSAGIAENDTTHLLKIEVLCSSLSGIDASVYFEITPRKVQIDSSVVKVNFTDSIQVIDSIGVKIVGGVEVPDTVYKDSIFTNTRDSVVYKVTDKGAKEGVHFTYTTNCIANDSNYVDSTKLFFTKTQYSDTIYIKTIDNDKFAGDTYFTITLKNANGANLGSSSVCEVTITDDEHPLAFMLGTGVASGLSYYDGAEQWAVNVAKDTEGDVTKVFITNLIPYTPTYTPLYGFVNEEKTELTIPVGQVQKGKYYLKLRFFTEYTYDDNGLDIDGELEDGDKIVCSIDANGNITTPDYVIWIQAYTDEAMTNLAGNWDVMIGSIKINH